MTIEELADCDDTDQGFLRLREFQLFAALPAVQLHALSGQATAREIRAGATLYHSEEPAEYVYLLASGAVMIESTMATPGRSLILALLRPGGVFGGLSSAPGERYGSGARTLQRSICYTLEAAYFAKLMRQNGRLALAVAVVLGRRQQRAVALSMELIRANASARLARALLDLAHDFGCIDPRGIRVSLRVTQTDLARLIGAARETVSTALADFRRRGWVAVERKRIWVLDKDALSRHAVT